MVGSPRCFQFTLDRWYPLLLRETASLGGTPPGVGGPASLFRLVLSVACWWEDWRKKQTSLLEMQSKLTREGLTLLYS